MLTGNAHDRINAKPHLPLISDTLPPYLLNRLGLKSNKTIQLTTQAPKTTSTPLPVASDSDICNLDVDYGSCQSYVHKWHYDKITRNCKTFVFGGCEGNGNKFDSEVECMNACAADHVTKPPVNETDLEEQTEETTTESPQQKEARLRMYRKK